MAVIPFEYGVPVGWGVFGVRDEGLQGAARTIKSMSQQPESRSPILPASPAPATGAEIASAAQSARHTHQRIPRWLERAELFLRVLLRMYIGLAICYAPWSRVFWDQNPLFLQFPTLSIYAANGAVRGIISGLGLLNLWIAFQDAIRQRDG
jgi:hypothetical protein